MGNVAIFVPHIGCPQRCSFCDQHAITGGAQAPTPRQVWDTAQAAASHLGERVAATEIAFFGGSFTAIPREYMLSLLEAGKAAVERFGFRGLRCSTRPDALDEGILALLKEHHMAAVELGAQSMDPQVLALNQRGHTPEDTRRAAGLVKAAGLELGLQMMTGLYGSTPGKDMETAKALIALGPDTARIYPTVVLEHTQLAALYRDGCYQPQTLEQAVSLCAKLLPLFVQGGVRVIRLGLHAEEGVKNHRVAGPYHPAFGELVESRLFLQSLLPALKQREPGSYQVMVSPKSLSVAVGQKRGNLALLKERGYLVRFVPREGVPRGGFVIVKPEINGEKESHDLKIFGAAGV